MRGMREKYGIVFIDGEEVVVRVYETDNKHWRLISYLKKEVYLETLPEKNPAAFAEAIADLFSSQTVQHIAEWRAFARALPDAVVCELSSATSLHIELLSKPREQELLCKGMFTEFW